MTFFENLDGDRIVAGIAVVMALTLVVGNGLTRRFGGLRAPWPMLVWMALVWAGIIAAAALAFAHFRSDGL